MIDKEYWETWAEGLLGAAADGDDEASRLYPVAHWLSLGVDVSDADKAELDRYIAWVSSNNGCGSC